MLAVLTLAQCTTPVKEKTQSTMKSGISQDNDRQDRRRPDSKVRQNIKARAEKGVAHAGSLWRNTDGSEDDFNTFCVSHFVADDSSLFPHLKELRTYFESMFGRYNQLVP